MLERGSSTVNIDHHHDNNRFGDVNLVDAAASSTSEVLADVFARLGVELTPEIAEPLYTALVTDTGRFQYANTTPKALRLAADLVEAGADVHKVFQGVYESVQFAKLKLLARALERAQVYEGGRLVVSYLLRDDFAEVGAAEPYSEGIIDYLRAVEGAEMAALIREPPRGGGPARRVSLRRPSTSWTSRRSPGKSGGGGHRQAAGFASDDSIEDITAFLVDGELAVPPPRALEPARDHPRRQAGRALVVRDRRRACGAGTGDADGPRGHARPVRDRPAAAALGPRDEGRAAVRRARQALPDRDRPVRADDHGRSGGRGRSSSGSRRTPDELSGCSSRSAARSSCAIPAASAVKIGGERAYKLHRRGVAVEMPLRRSRVDALDVLLDYDGRRRDARPPRRLGDLRAFDRRRARRPLPHAAAHGDRPVLGRRGRRGAVVIPVDEALARLG